MYRHLAAAEPDPNAPADPPRSTLMLIAGTVILIAIFGVALIVYGEKLSENPIQYIISGAMVILIGLAVGVYALVLYARR